MKAYYLAESVKDLVEIYQYLPLCNLGNVIHAFARIVTDPGILIGEAGKHRRYYLFEVLSDFLHKRSALQESILIQGTNRSQSYRSCS